MFSPWEEGRRRLDGLPGALRVRCAWGDEGPRLSGGSLWRAYIEIRENARPTNSPPRLGRALPALLDQAARLARLPLASAKTESERMRRKGMGFDFGQGSPHSNRPLAVYDEVCTNVNEGRTDCTRPALVTQEG